MTFVEFWSEPLQFVAFFAGWALAMLTGLVIKDVAR